MMTFKQVQEGFDGKVWRNENGVQNSYCVTFPNSNKVYTYKNIPNLETLNEKLHESDHLYNESLQNRTLYDETTGAYYTESYIPEAN